jgi:hypothetical protein
LANASFELLAYHPNFGITALAAASAAAGKTYREACAWQPPSDPPPHVADMEMDRSSLCRALDPMVRDEWVKIRVGPDPRSRTAVITSKGYRVLTKGGRQWEQVQTRVVER